MEEATEDIMAYIRKRINNMNNDEKVRVLDEVQSQCSEESHNALLLEYGFMMPDDDEN